MDSKYLSWGHEFSGLKITKIGQRVKDKQFYDLKNNFPILCNSRQTLINICTLCLVTQKFILWLLRQNQGNLKWKSTAVTIFLLHKDESINLWIFVLLFFFCFSHGSVDFIFVETHTGVCKYIIS